MIIRLFMINTERVQNSNYMEYPIIACLLALASGLIDGYTYSTTKVFATFQTGNIFLPTMRLSTITLEDFLPCIISFLSFGLGAMVLSFIRDWNVKKDRIWIFKILVFEMVFILALSTNVIHHFLSPLHLTWLLAFVIGMQGNAFRQIDNKLYSNITFSMNVLFTFSFLVEGLQDKSKRRSYFIIASHYFLVFAFFFLGVLISTSLYKTYMMVSFVTAIIPLSIILGVGKLLQATRSGCVK